MKKRQNFRIFQIFILTAILSFAILGSSCSSTSHGFNYRAHTAKQNKHKGKAQCKAMSANSSWLNSTWGRISGQH